MTTSAGVEYDGAAELSRSLGRLADDLEHMEATHRKAGDDVLGRVNPPRDSGELEDSAVVEATDSETVIGYTAVYAGKIHDGWPERNINPQPWLANEPNEAQVTDLFADDIGDMVGRVRGA